MNEIIEKVASDLNLPTKFVDSVYKSYWQAIRQYISELPLKTADNISNIKTNINIPSLGKFHCTEEEFNRLKHKYEIIKNKTNV